MRKFCKKKLDLDLANKKEICCHYHLTTNETNRHNKQTKFFLAASSHIYRTMLSKLILSKRETLKLNICSYFRVLCKFPN